jgi:hypothetical protein
MANFLFPSLLLLAIVILGMRIYHFDFLSLVFSNFSYQATAKGICGFVVGFAISRYSKHHHRPDRLGLFGISIIIVSILSIYDVIPSKFLDICFVGIVLLTSDNRHLPDDGFEPDHNRLQDIRFIEQIK